MMAGDPRILVRPAVTLDEPRGQRQLLEPVAGQPGLYTPEICGRCLGIGEEPSA